VKPQQATAVRRIEIGAKLYLFTAEDSDGNHPSRLIITSHGGYHERTVRDRASKGWMTVPGWTRLFFYGDHGLALYDPGTRNLLGYRPTQEQAPDTMVENYVLSKFQARGGGSGNETYESITSGMDRSHELLQQQKEALARFGLDLDEETDAGETERKLADVEASASDARKYELTMLKGKRQVELYDVLTVRNRRLRSDLTLRDLLRELESHGHRYAEIHCAFCRSPILPESRSDEIGSTDAVPEPRWARTGNYVRRPQ